MNDTIEITKDIYCKVSEFKGKMRVDIRRYYRDGNGDLQPTTKGLNVSVPEWAEMVKGWDALVEAVQAKLTGAAI